MFNDLVGNITNYLFIIPSALIALTFHEVSHGYVAYKLGDPTAKNFGRLSLNPLKHLDPIGSLCMIFFRFGWAKPVPINVRYFKNQKIGMALSAAAGPIANFLLAFVSLFFGCLVEMLVLKFPPTSLFAYNLSFAVLLMFQYFHIYNLSFAVFNLIPSSSSAAISILLPFASASSGLTFLLHPTVSISAEILPEYVPSTLAITFQKVLLPLRPSPYAIIRASTYTLPIADKPTILCT